MKYKKIKKISGGFTLIEVLIYIALSSILLTGLIVSAYSLIDGNRWLMNNVFVLQEGHFALQKINWLVQNENLADIEIYLDEGRLWIRREGKPSAITSSRVTVESFNFKDGNLEFSVGGIIFKRKYE